VPPALEQLRNELAAVLASWRLEFESIRATGTPRRLVLLVEGLAEKQPDRRVDVQGPPKQACFDADGNPTKALEGFAKAQGVELDQVTFEETDKGVRATVVVDEPGRSASEVLAEVLPRVILCPSFPKTMRWAHRKVRYGRPIRWIVALLDGDIICLAIEDIESGRTSRGHRFLGSDSVEIPSAAEYFDIMRSQFVMVDHDERREEIRKQVLAAAREAGGEPMHLDEVLEENLHLVEWPTAFTGRFSEEFLDLPEVVPTTVMRKHQKYFPVADADGKLLPCFVAVRNGGSDHIDEVIKGNQIVVHGRLRDAVFFFRNDLERDLWDRTKDLERVVFIHGLGNLAEKTERVIALTDQVADALDLGVDLRDQARRAANLCKADLTTSLVIEFTSLQGVLGGVYAAHGGEPEGVAKAIGEHYRPASADDALPSTLPGTALSIADKLDTVAGVLSLGEAPTGTADPHGVRRRLQGVAAMVMRKALPLDAMDLAAKALAQYASDDDAAESQLSEMLRQRAEAVLEQEGVDLHLREAVLGVSWARLGQSLAVARAIQRLDADEPETLDAAWRAATRPANIVEKRESDSTEVDSALFEGESEARLHVSVARMETAADVFDREIGRAALEDRTEAVETHATVALRNLAEEAAAVDGFFDEVMVMADDPKVKANRLALLYRAHLAITRIADLSALSRE
jgi:glycyl-tRNA synthetase beta chain